MRPDLSDPAARAACKTGLSGLARRWRLLGFDLILVGVAVQFYIRSEGIENVAPAAASSAMIALGWVIFIAIIARRTGYHEARLAGD